MSFQKKEFICEYSGTIVEGEIVNKSNYMIHLAKNKHLVLRNNAVLSEPSRCFAATINTARNLKCPITGKIFTSTKNNCKMKISKDRVRVYAARNIEAGEELFITYGSAFKLN